MTYVLLFLVHLRDFELVQDELNIERRKLIRPVVTRWLSHDASIQSLAHLMPAIILFLLRVTDRDQR